MMCEYCGNELKSNKDLKNKFHSDSSYCSILEKQRIKPERMAWGDWDVEHRRQKRNAERLKQAIILAEAEAEMERKATEELQESQLPSNL